MVMKKVVIITNVPSPYRVAFFRYMQERESEYSFHVIYTSQNSDIGRQWKVGKDELGNHSFLKCKVITIPNRYDDRRIVFSVGVTKKLKKLQPDIVVCMEYNATILQAVHWCKKNKVPFLSWSDGTANSERKIGRLQKMFRSYVIRRAAGFVASSTATMERQISLGAKEELCHKCLLTVDIQKYLKKKPADYVPGKKLLYVGSLIERKGLDLLMPALAMTDPEVTLMIVGEGPEERILKEQIRELGLVERVTFLGYLEGEALNACYEKADAFVLPTREDCYGLVVLEGMCHCLPVITSKYADGSYDLIVDGVHGAITDPYQPKELAQAIDRLFADREELLKMQERCYQRALEFRFDAVCGGFYEALDAV